MMAKRIENDLEHLLDSWRRAGVPLRTGVSQERLRNHELALGKRLPSDFSTYYLRVDGMPDGVYDTNGIRFWPLHELSDAAKEMGNADEAGDGFVIFADYSIWTHTYGVQLTESGHGRIALLGGPQPIEIASSFGEFIGYYLDEPSRLFPAG